jgi:hypothetical protein
VTHAEAARIAALFWLRAGTAEPFPRSLERSVLWALPLTIVKIPRLRLSSIAKWMDRHRIPPSWPPVDRCVRACLVAERGHGVVFLDGADPADELRFSLAHEAAHFLLDYDQPRDRAISVLGESILDVLHGRRSPTPGERLSAVLRGAQLGAYTHLSDRTSAGELINGHALAAEDRADRVALELLAPRVSVIAARRPLRTMTTSDNCAQLAALLTAQFGLPPAVAARYASFLAAEQTPASFREWLGLSPGRNPVELGRARRNKKSRRHRS